MKADPEAQRRLLDLQAIDTALAQLAHRRSRCPSSPSSTTLARELSALEDERVRAQVAVDDLDRDIARLEKDVEQVRARKDRDQARLDAGPAPPRELEALQHELATLQPAADRAGGRRAGADGAAGDGAGGARRRAGAAGRGARAARGGRAAPRRGARRDRQGARSSRPAARRPLAADLPADLVTLYDKIREESGGWARRCCGTGRCGGCRLELSGADLARVKAAPRRRGRALRGVPADHGPHRGVRPVTRRLRVIVEADGGRAGQPRPGRLRRGRARRGHRRGAGRAVGVARASRPTTSPSTPG